MKELAQKMTDLWGGAVMEELWIYNAISAYCYSHNIELTDDEELEVFELIWNHEV